MVFDAPLVNGARLHVVLLYSDAELRLNRLNRGECVTLHLPDIDFRGPATVVRIEASAATGEAEAQVLQVVRFRNDEDLGTALYGDWNPPDELVKHWRSRRRQIVLKLDYPNGGWCDIRLLRTVDWIAQSGAKVGGVVFLSLVDVGIRGWAKVLEILPCGQVETGRGGMVSGTFRHSSAEVYDLKLESETKPIGVTAMHPFWSCDRRTWVSAVDLRLGERLKTLTGTTVVERMSKRPDPEPVYNIEVEGDHVYRVGESGVLVHNTSAPPAGHDFGCENLSGQGNLQRGDINLSIAGGVPQGYAGHHLIGVAEASRYAVMRRAAQLGYNLNGGNNGIALPTSVQESRRTGLPLHTNRHLRNYTNCVDRHLRRLQRDYDSGVISDCDLCVAIERIENDIRRALLAHEIWLQNADPNISQGATSQCSL